MKYNYLTVDAGLYGAAFAREATKTGGMALTILLNVTC